MLFTAVAECPTQKHIMPKLLAVVILKLDQYYLYKAKTLIFYDY